MEKPRFKNGKKPIKEMEGLCNYPRNDCQPCELKKNHMGMHRFEMSWYGDSGVPEKW